MSASQSVGNGWLHPKVRYRERPPEKQLDVYGARSIGAMNGLSSIVIYVVVILTGGWWVIFIPTLLAAGLVGAWRRDHLLINGRGIRHERPPWRPREIPWTSIRSVGWSRPELERRWLWFPILCLAFLTAGTIWLGPLVLMVGTPFVIFSLTPPGSRLLIEPIGDLGDGGWPNSPTSLHLATIADPRTGERVSAALEEIARSKGIQFGLALET